MKAGKERFTHYARVFWIDHQLRANNYPNTHTIAAHFEVTRKTAQRTLDFMRDQLRLPLGYSAEHRGWFYTEPTYALPDVQISEGDLVAVLLAERMVRAYKGTAIAMQLEQTFTKMLYSMTDLVSVDFNSLADAYSFEAAVTTDLDVETLRQLGAAAKNQLRLEMTYYTATRGRLTRRSVDPLHLRNHLGEWYLIAYDHLRKDVRDFHASRIRELKTTSERFDWPEGFDLAAYLDSGFAMIRGSQAVEVIMDFDEYQARWMRERGPVHPSEQREELDGGGLRIRLKVTALDGVRRFVMQYGSHVEVIAPEQLRLSIAEEIKAMTALYDGDRQ